MKHSKRVRVEWGKNILIAALSLSALYLSFKTLIYPFTPREESLLGNIYRLFQSDDGSQTPPADASSLAGLTRPVRIAVTTQDGRYGVQYDVGITDEIYEDTASLLAECLLRAGTPHQATAAQWRGALERMGIYYDFLGDIPLCVLAAGLGQDADHSQLTQSARRLLLTDDGEDGILLWFWDSQSNLPYQCQTSSVLQSSLEQTTSRYLPNGAVFAFQSGGSYGRLSDQQLFVSETPALPIYSAMNPLAGDSALTDSLLRVVGMNPHSLFTASDGTQVARDGSCTIRIAPSGSVQFTSDTDSSAPRLPISASGATATAAEAVDAAYALLNSLLLPATGDAQVYLSACNTASEGEWNICFDYSLSGAQVKLAGSDCAAHFSVKGRQITQFSLCLRTYTATDQTSSLLPEPQAVAALLALNGAGRELLAAYLDTYEGRISASWITP